jgi:hypothetical protein
MRYDLFANSANTVCPAFFSPTEDVGSMGIDALRQDWRQLCHAWIFPPTQLIEAVLKKLHEERPPHCVLILPELPQAHWWPLFVKLKPRTRPLLPKDFRVDGPGTSSIFLSLSKRFLAARIL